MAMDIEGIRAKALDAAVRLNSARITKGTINMSSSAQMDQVILDAQKFEGYIITGQLPR